MIKKILVFTGLLITSFRLSAQYYVTDPIYLGPDNIHSFVGQIGDWGSTHGSPDYFPSYFFMWYNKDWNVGEGVFKRFNFMPDTEYDIYIGIPSSETFPDHNQNGFKVLLANNVVANGIQNQGSSIPAFPSSRQLYSHVGANFSDKTLRLKFRTYSQGYENIVFYPVTTIPGGHATLALDCITITSCSIDDNYYCYNTTISPGTTAMKNIYIGSSFGNIASLTSSDPTQSTEIVATKKIELRENTNLSVDPGKTVVLDVRPYDCLSAFPLNLPFGVVEHEFRAGACGYARPGNDTKSGSIDFNPDLPQSNIKCFTVTPNPTKGLFRISFAQAPEAAEVSVTSIDGRIVKQEKISGKSQTEIDISSLPNGIYFVRVTDGTRIEVQKVVKQ
ncbi:T9SS type A sorting domain-containing protein [Taibaiella chishuiensis]|uniref:Putative secreted protein (Por secretion system target) n=1 Tax=Taibaiella chishuiensis TaxID=1434707 RepID=A0A2P8DBE4_9BACT|nr:T9SS type A sorting domain-containing protein [Taibaiella chishuiensis]PSK94534.1 putative secreted protein (Por secretion system target) [Taibaiella chishuiensis]